KRPVPENVGLRLVRTQTLSDFDQHDLSIALKRDLTFSRWVLLRIQIQIQTMTRWDIANLSIPVSAKFPFDHEGKLPSSRRYPLIRAAPLERDRLNLSLDLPLANENAQILNSATDQLAATLDIARELIGIQAREFGCVLGFSRLVAMKQAHPLATED